MDVEVLEEVLAVVGTSLSILLMLSPIPAIVQAYKSKNL